MMSHSRAFSRQEENKLHLALQELKASKDLCEQLNNERDGNERELLDILKNNDQLKTELSMLQVKYSEVEEERIRLQSLVARLDECGLEYEKAFRRTNILKLELRDAHQQILELEEAAQNSANLHTHSLFEELINNDTKLVTATTQNHCVTIDFTNDTLNSQELGSCSKQWITRKEALRVQRELHYGLKKERARRQVTNRQVEAVTESRLEISSRKSSPPSRISAGESEWSGATGGPPAEVVLRLHPSTTTYPDQAKRYNISTAEIEPSKVTDCPPAEVVLRRHSSKSPPEITIANMSLSNMGSSSSDGSGVVVRAEEALIVAFVLLLWVAAIALFFNRWGKIRCVYKLMLEPYQPKFQQQHRQSCVLAENSVSVPPHHRASLSRGCVSYDYGGSFPSYQPCGYLTHRQRQNSVFVGSMGGMALIPESPPRRSRSAADLPALITPSDHMPRTPRSSRAASLHSAVDLRVCVPSPRTSRAASLHSATDMPQGSVQVHVRGSVTNLNRPRSPRRLTITNV